MSATGSEVEEAARERLGLDHLRPAQEEAVRAVAAGRDTLTILATGSGKTAIYELAAQLRGGPAVVISPLLALQRDQREAIDDHRVGGAELVNSRRSESDIEEAFERTERGANRFLLLAPEQLLSRDLRARLRRLRPALFVVDEAHCVSEWGHGFRPEYLRLGDWIDELGHSVVLALTATASPWVRRDIVRNLRLRDPLVAVHGFDRPNIHLRVVSPPDPGGKREALYRAVTETPGAGIVYAATRRSTEELARDLGERGVRAVPYHAGLSARRRREGEKAFLEGEVPVMVATIAFGMGVNKPDVRFVFHADPPPSLDAYHQEIGRAGRDGQGAGARLFYRSDDLRLARFLAAPPRFKDEPARRLLECSRKSQAASPGQLAQTLGITQRSVSGLLAALREVGAVQVEDGLVRASGQTSPEAAVEAAAERRRQLRSFHLSRVELVRGYAETEGCRRQYLLASFGQQMDEPCGNCDNCERGLAGRLQEGPFPIGSEVRHPRWGPGEVLRYEPDSVLVLFETAGYRRLDLDTVRRRRLLKPVA